MKEKKETEKFVCWTSEKEKVLSFHYEDGYTRKEFNAKADFQNFIVLTVSGGYKVQ